MTRANWSVLSCVRLVVACMLAWLLGAAYGGGDEHRGTTMESQSLRVTETPKYFEILFSADPEARFLLHCTDLSIVVAQPGKKTVAPSFDQVRSITFIEKDGVLEAEWDNVADGGTEKAMFRGMDRAAWERLKKFVAAKVTRDLKLREVK